MSEQQSGGTAGREVRERGWDPFGELQALRTELGRMVGSALVRDRGGPPEIELNETAEGWNVLVRLPGVAPEEVALELDDRELLVRARSEAEVNADQGLPGGQQTRTFEYRIDLPSRVDPERIDATMDHGLLHVTLPRASRPARRTITIGSRAPMGRSAAQSPDPAADRELHHPDIA